MRTGWTGSRHGITIYRNVFGEEPLCPWENNGVIPSTMDSGQDMPPSTGCFGMLWFGVRR